MRDSKFLRDPFCKSIYNFRGVKEFSSSPHLFARYMSRGKPYFSFDPCYSAADNTVRL